MTLPTDPAPVPAPAPAPAAARLASPPVSSPLRRLLGPIAVVVIVVGAFRLFQHENQYEKMATSVTQAIVNNDMRPVERDFNALRRPQLEDRAKVGMLSDELNALGALKNVTETKTDVARAGYHTFEAHFQKSTWVEDMTLDGDGKIASFHVHAP
jgi:hypothetical protein